MDIATTRPATGPLPDALLIHSDDNVAVALRALAVGEQVEVGGLRVTINQPVASGHKFALADIAAGEKVRKFGWPIGAAIAAIEAGDHVHSHNVQTLLKGEETYRYEPLVPAELPTSNATFQGYRRPDGRVGTRNEIWILPTVGCVARTSERIARDANEQRPRGIDGVFAFGHPHGCSQLGSDLGGVRSILTALACHPNAGGVLLVGLGCESNQLDALIAEIPEELRGRLRTLRAQSEEDETEAGLRLVGELMREASNAKREEVPLSELVLGLKCGGSDGYSGLTANALVGRMCDVVVGSGGSAILTEIPETFGAEQLLMARARSEPVFDAIVTLTNDFKRYFLENGQPVSENPSPGNIAGGITTLEEKSLGAVQKGGQTPVADVLRYAERVRIKGLSLLEAPGNDAVSSTALAAAGATVILFTTGRGTPLGFPVPTVKIASNSDLAQRKTNWIDFDGGRVLGEESDAVAADLLQRVTEIASGDATAAERNGEREIAIWKRGVTL
jgi:altronate hydrolase